MIRRPLLVLALVAVSSSAVGAQAAPVAQSRRAEAILQLALEHGETLDVTVSLTTGKLRVETRSCDAQGCQMPEAWSGPTAGGALDDSRAQARLRTTLAGVPLSVTWTPSPSQGVVLQTLDASGGQQGDTASSYHGDPADVRVTLGSQTCEGTGSVGDEVRVSDSDSDGAAPLADLRLPEGVLSC